MQNIGARMIAQGQEKDVKRGQDAIRDMSDSGANLALERHIKNRPLLTRDGRGCSAAAGR